MTLGSLPTLRFYDNSILQMAFENTCLSVKYAKDRSRVAAAVGGSITLPDYVKGFLQYGTALE